MPDNIGSLIIVRKDGGELKPQMLQVFFRHVASKLETDGTKPPFPTNRIEVLTQQDILAWMKMMVVMEMFEIVPDEPVDQESGAPEEVLNQDMEEA